MNTVFCIGTSGWSYPASTEGSWKGVFYPPGDIEELSGLLQEKKPDDALVLTDLMIAKWEELFE